MVAIQNIPPEVELEDVDCPNGCKRSDELLFTGHDRLHDLPGEFAVVRCRTCDLIRTNPRPTPSTIGYYYPSDYRLHKAVGTEDNTVRARSGSLPKRVVRRALDSRSKAIPDLPPGHLYEVGCGNGAYMRVMVNQGWTAEGLEPSAQGAENARALGFHVENTVLETAEGPKQAPDLIAAWMVLEHLHDPIGCLKRLYDWSKPGTWIAASIPNADSLEFSSFQGAWYGLHMPAHLFFYTPKTIGNVFEASGWGLERVIHQRNVSNLVVSTGFKLDDLGIAGPLARRLVRYPELGGWPVYATHPLATLMAALGQTGRMTVWARRL